MHECDVETIDAEALQAVLDRAPDTVRGVADDEIARRVRKGIQRLVAIRLRRSEKFAHLRRPPVFRPFLIVQEITEPSLCKPQTVPERKVVIPHPGILGGFDLGLGFPVGNLVELVPEPNSSYSEAEFRLEDLRGAARLLDAWVSFQIWLMMGD